MTEDLCRVVDSKFVDFSSQTNGGVFYLNKSKELRIFRCFFVRCSTSQSSNGGGIYFESSKSLITFGNCASECVAGRGYFIFVRGAAKVKFFLNETMTTKCSGSDYSVCNIQTSDLYSRMYNSSFCSSKNFHNVQSYYNEVTDSMFHQYYKNNQDIVYGVNSDGPNHRLSHMCLIENGRSNGNFGYIHTNYYENEVLTVNYLYVYGNDVGIPIANPYNGMIVINNFTGDRFNHVGNGQIRTSNIIINSSFVMTTLYKNIFVCEGNIKIICKTNQSVNRISIFFIFLSFLILK
jgi:hypothetical protein